MAEGGRLIEIGVSRMVGERDKSNNINLTLFMPGAGAARLPTCQILSDMLHMSGRGSVGTIQSISIYTNRNEDDLSERFDA